MTGLRPFLAVVVDAQPNTSTATGQSRDATAMPFVPSNADGPKGLDPQALRLGLDQVGWQRWWILIVDGSRVIGHANLKGDSLKTGLHRCELGIGLERPYRAQGHGRCLMGAAIDYARSARSLAWIDLRVFSHNVAGLALYQSLGFAEVGTINDRFRIDGAVIDDVAMALNVE